jgi:hypothetical protein
MTIGLVITVKNEARIIRHNLVYHKAIGVDKVFVYFDDSTDSGKASISDLDFVEISNSVSDNRFEHIKSLSHFNSKAKEHHTARQCLNTYDAIQKCKISNIDWLISIDADELVITDTSEVSQLKPFFKTIDATIDVINFRPFEALQAETNYDNVFAELTVFKRIPKFKQKIDRIYKQLYNPFSKKNIKFSYWYGQHMGKSAVRVNSTTEIIPKNVHRYVYIDKTAVNSIDKMGLVHYHMYDAQDFIKKFKNFENHPNTFLSGNKVEDIKLLCRDIVNLNVYDADGLIKYFKDYIMFKPSEVKKLRTNRNRFFIKRKQKAIIEITSVQAVFKNLIL